MDRTQEEIYEIFRVCLLAGKIMLMSGAETYRVEDTMSRIAASCGFDESHSFVTPTAIVFSIDGMELTKLIRISERSTDLRKVDLVNSISRSMSSKTLTVQDAHKRLKEIEAENLAYPLWLQFLAAAISSGCFVIIFLGKWIDFLPGCIAGGIGFLCTDYLHRTIRIRFFAEFIASIVIGLIAYSMILIGVGQQIDKIIIGAVMPLVPGLAITNALRDLMAGHLFSGVSKGAEAFLTSFAIGSGIAIVLTIF
ncbi:threonine/serine exporter family protein [Heyndrickxia ginsengihumi]|uniref:Membrane protein n=1 Tax=Heyndrickxia ginsengihumi TaxID=363870 RepID=A0A0A6Y3D7_9BACI|nr:threonine/serine exporter family protein [Heyndrickxia ginsengihumi]KHD86772.1 membrane protein [Heyndrickxia ginsengihumi]MBE6183754.1 threonine/serine exporter family protein [Bacillus sp. (in: firmicutes)]MCM3022248.1 threonine/serine exporter family protein [Heyndrickxia ginsengihumi]NEY18481.1 threonine/serine exporter family protein [Heyndrickxia ginsengihumi]